MFDRIISLIYHDLRHELKSYKGRVNTKRVRQRVFKTVEEVLLKYTDDEEFIKYISDRLIVAILSKENVEGEKNEETPNG